MYLGAWWKGGESSSGGWVIEMTSWLSRDRIYQCCGGEYPPPSIRMKLPLPLHSTHMRKVNLCLGSPIMSWPVRKQMTCLLEHQWLPDRIFVDPEPPWYKARLWAAGSGAEEFIRHQHAHASKCKMWSATPPWHWGLLGRNQKQLSYTYLGKWSRGSESRNKQRA